MKKFKLLLMPLIISPCLLLAQSSANGTVIIPMLQSMNMELLNSTPLDFSDLNDFKTGKFINGYCSINVKSNGPWVLSARLNSMSFANGKVPLNLISVRVAGTQKFIPLNEQFAPILTSSNDLISNNYTLDLHVDPQLNVLQQVLMLDIQFKVTPQ